MTNNRKICPKMSSPRCCGVVRDDEDALNMLKEGFYLDEGKIWTGVFKCQEERCIFWNVALRSGKGGCLYC